MNTYILAKNEQLMCQGTHCSFFARPSFDQYVTELTLNFVSVSFHLSTHQKID